MKEDESGASQSRLQTDQGTPKEISSTPGEMKVSQMNTTSSGTRKKMYLLECNEDILTGETNYCRRIPIYDEPIPVAVIEDPGTPTVVSTTASRQVTAKGGCTPTKCDISSRLERGSGKSTSKKASGREMLKND